MSDDPQVAALLLERGLVTPAMLRHGRALSAAVTGAEVRLPLGLVLVDLGYLDERALAESIAQVAGARLWDGAPFDAAVAQRVQVDTPDVLALAREGSVLHYATIDPRDPDEAEALRRETGARELVPWVTTRGALWEARQRAAADAPGARPRGADAHARVPTDASPTDPALIQLVSSLLLDAAQHGALRLLLGDGTLAAARGRPFSPWEDAPPARLGPAIVRRLRVMAELGEDAGEVYEGSVIRFVAGRNRLVDFELQLFKTDAGRCVLLERRAVLAVFRSDMQAHEAAVDAARDPKARERAIRAWLAAADALGDAGAHAQLDARAALAEHCLAEERLGEAADVAREAIQLCEAVAPSRRFALEPFIIGLRPRDGRAEAWERLGDRVGPHRSAFVVIDALVAALLPLDPGEQPELVERLGRRIETLERELLGARSLGTATALINQAWARGAVGAASAEATAADARELSGRLFGADLGAAQGDRVLGLVRAAQGRKREAEGLLRAAMEGHVRCGASHSSVAVELAGVLPPERAAESRELCEAALASGDLGVEEREEARRVLARCGETHAHR
jgi:hypothetical protein